MISILEEALKIFAGIIITYFFLPVFQKFWYRNVKKYRDQLYEDASSRHTDRHYCTHRLQLSSWFILVYVLFLFLFNQYFLIKDKYHGLLSATKPAPLISHSNDLMNVAKMYEIYLANTIVIYFMLFSFAAVAISEFWQFFRSEMIDTLFIDFHQNIKTIRPMITVQEYHLLERKWALMSNEDDFKSIFEEMKAYSTRKIDTDFQN